MKLLHHLEPLHEHTKSRLFHVALVRPITALTLI